MLKECLVKVAPNVARANWCARRLALSRRWMSPAELPRMLKQNGPQKWPVLPITSSGPPGGIRTRGLSASHTSALSTELRADDSSKHEPPSQ